MSFWSAIVLIVLITAVASVMRHRGGRGGKHSNNAQIQQSARERQLQDEVEQLRERIHVLERIETRRISEEIEKLREGHSEAQREQEG